MPALVYKENPNYTDDLNAFLGGKAERPKRTLPAVSLFSNAGIGDFGYGLAGFEFKVHAEKEPERCAIIRRNNPNSSVIEGDLRRKWRKVVEAYRASTDERLELLAASPPCQGMTSTNQKTDDHQWGNVVRQDARNNLYTVVGKVAGELNPRVIVVENVPGILNTGVKVAGLKEPMTVAQALHAALPNYHEVTSTIQMADYGIPQSRVRTFFVFAHKDEGWFQDLVTKNLLPLPAPTHGPGTTQDRITAKQALNSGRFRKLDARSVELSKDKTDPLHRTTVIDSRRYEWVARNPKNSGRSSFLNLDCECGFSNGPKPVAQCHECGETLPGVPTVVDGDEVRLVKGRMTAYKRIDPDEPAPTITTASGHFGSDNSVHPWENRLLSIRECAEFQAIPHSFKFIEEGVKKYHATNVRSVIGEAIPPYFTWLLGRVIYALLVGQVPENLMERNGETFESLTSPRVPITHGVSPRRYSKRSSDSS